MKNLMKIKSCKVLAHRMDHSKPKQYILCTRRLRTPRDDCAVRVQRFSSGIRISDIVSWDRKYYLPHVILPRLLSEGCTLVLKELTRHSRQVTSLVC